MSHCSLSLWNKVMHVWGRSSREIHGSKCSSLRSVESLWSSVELLQCTSWWRYPGYPLWMRCLTLAHCFLQTHIFYCWRTDNRDSIVTVCCQGAHEKRDLRLPDLPFIYPPFHQMHCTVMERAEVEVEWNWKLKQHCYGEMWLCEESTVSPGDSSASERLSLGKRKKKSHGGWGLPTSSFLTYASCSGVRKWKT